MYIKTMAAVIAAFLITACGGGGASESEDPKISNSAPVASNLEMLRNNTALTSSDILLLNDVITFQYDYQDAENDPQGSSVLEWQRTEADGSVTVINGAASSSYTVTAADLAMSLSASVVPVATIGTLEGIAVYSLGVNVTDGNVANNSAPVAANVKLLRNGTALSGSNALLLGDVISLSYEYQDAESDAQGSSVFAWQRTDVNDNVTVINGAASNGYTVTADDVAQKISASVIPVAATGTQQGAAVFSSAFNVIENNISENSAPTATNVTLIRNGTALSNGDALALGDVITVSYEYQDAEDDAQGSSVLEWQRTYAEDNVIVIAGATSNNYTIAVDDLANGISASVKPVATVGTLEGAVVASSVINVTNNTVPVAQDVGIRTVRGGIKVGSVLTGNYSFVDAEGDGEGASTYRWLAIASDTTETELGTERTLTLPHSALNNTITFEVTPIATAGLVNGVANRSSNEAVVSDYAFFTASEPVEIDAINGITENQPHLFISNGTVEGTTQLLNLDGALITQPLAVGSKWVFLLDRNTTSDSLMVTDGTPEGTSVIISSRSSKYPADLVSMNGLVYFSASEPTNGRGVWSTDGTVENTKLLDSISPDEGISSPSGFAILGDKLYFSAQGFDSDNKSTGQELFSVSLDGSDGSVALVKDINPGPEGSNPSSLTVFKDLLYFGAWDGKAANDAGGNELWVSDGTPNGTNMLKDLTVGAHSYPANFTEVKDDLYFTTITNGGELWRTRGTGESTTEVGRDDHQAASNLTAFKGKLIYRAAVSEQADILWAATADTDTDTDLTPIDVKYPAPVAVLADQILFQSSDVNNDYELYGIDDKQINDGSAPELISNINNIGSSSPNSLIEINGAIIFSANDGVTGYELWSSDGQSATLIKDFIPGSEGSFPNLTLPSAISIPR